MSKEGKFVAVVFVVMALVVGSLAYWSSSRMASNTPDAGASTSGAAPPR